MINRIEGGLILRQNDCFSRKDTKNAKERPPWFSLRTLRLCVKQYFCQVHFMIDLRDN